MEVFYKLVNHFWNSGAKGILDLKEPFKHVFKNDPPTPDFTRSSWDTDICSVEKVGGEWKPSNNHFEIALPLKSLD